MVVLRIILAGLLAAASCASAAAPPDLAPVEEWIRKQADVRTIVADFRQERHVRTVRKPLVSTGRLWLTAGGPFRWQTGDPPALIAILNAAGEFTVVRPEKKEASVISREALEREEAARGLAFLHAGFPRSLDEFRRQFSIDSVTPAGDYDKVEGRPAGAGSASGVRKMVLYLHRPTRKLTSMQIHFRDGSWISNTFTGIQENAAIPPAQFEIDLSGYEVTRK